jgi:hypothetical protein
MREGFTGKLLSLDEALRPSASLIGGHVGGTLQRAKKALGVPTDAEVVRLSLERAAEMEEFWRFMHQNRRMLKPGSIKSP